MMSNNKILTVSYGTFSCTLEGFDESFDTMKAIAEYFRDLAADDRYFGAEPPQPDAEMLARIAEREIARRVEAHASEAGIHLRAGGAMAAITAGETATDPSRTQAPSAPEAPDRETAEVPQDTEDDTAPAVAADASAPAAPTGTGFTVHQVYDQHLSAALFNSTFTAIAQTGSGNLTGAAPERAPASVVGETDEPVAADEVEPAAIAEPAAEEPDQNRDDVAEFFAQAPRQEIRSAEVVSAPVRKLEPNSIADKLQRIRAVVSKSQPAPQTFSEDEHAEEILDEDKADNTILMADFFSKPDMAPDSDGSDEETGFAAGLATAETVAGEETGPDQQVTREDLADTVAEDGEYEDGEYDVAEDGDDENDLADVAELDGDADDDADADLTATLARIGADFEDGDTPGAPVEEIAPSEKESDDADHGYDFSGLFADDEAADEDGAEPEAVVEATDVDATWQEPAVRARVIKVKRSEFRAAMDAGMLETDPAEDSVADFDSDAPTAEVETGELGAPETTADPSDDTFESATDEDIRDGDGAYMPAESDDDVGMDEEELDRLMTEADQKMDDPDGNTRRAAFDQMRAAVDASKDDDDLSADEEDDDEAEYRTDFAEAVKPRRPMAGTRTDRPRDQRPAPLKLVAEQRVDLPTAKTGPVQPRRVAATAYPETVETEGGFAEYATTLGAHDLPDLLEAAASYLSFVEGRDQFSRPQLMTKVRQLDPEGFSREDGLRHFGQLLRAGKIEKIKGGRFTVSDDIGFRPDGKRATG